MQATKTVGFIFAESTIFEITTINGIKFYTQDVISGEEAGEYKNFAQLLQKNKDKIICLDHSFDSQKTSAEKMQVIFDIIKIHKNQLPPTVSQKINNFLQQKFAAKDFAKGLSIAGLHDSPKQTLAEAFQGGMNDVISQMEGSSSQEKKNLAKKMLEEVKQESQDLPEEHKQIIDALKLQLAQNFLSENIMQNYGTQILENQWVQKYIKEESEKFIERGL